MRKDQTAAAAACGGGRGGGGGNQNTYPIPPNGTPWWHVIGWVAKKSKIGIWWETKRKRQEMSEKGKTENRIDRKNQPRYYSPFGGFFLAVTPQSEAQRALENRKQTRSESEDRKKKELTNSMASNHKILRSLFPSPDAKCRGAWERTARDIFRWNRAYGSRSMMAAWPDQPVRNSVERNHQWTKKRECSSNQNFSKKKVKRNWRTPLFLLLRSHFPFFPPETELITQWQIFSEREARRGGDSGSFCLLFEITSI